MSSKFKFSSSFNSLLIFEIISTFPSLISNSSIPFDKLKNPKRSYLRDLIKETIKY